MVSSKKIKAITIMVFTMNSAVSDPCFVVACDRTTYDTLVRRFRHSVTIVTMHEFNKWANSASLQVMEKGFAVLRMARATYVNMKNQLHKLNKVKFWLYREADPVPRFIDTRLPMPGHKNFRRSIRNEHRRPSRKFFQR